MQPASVPAPVQPTKLDFTELYRECFGFVWRCLQVHGVPPRLLDDAAQEVFLAVHRGQATFRGQASPRTWLYGIVRNVAYKQRRALARRATEPLADEPAADGPTPQDSAEGAQAAAFVRDFVASLDEPKRDVFVLLLLEGLSAPEAAAATGAPLNTIYTRLRAVRAEFRAALTRHRGAEPP